MANLCAYAYVFMCACVCVCVQMSVFSALMQASVCESLSSVNGKGKT